MKRIILILIVAAVGAYFVHGYLESKERKKAQQERVVKLKESTRAAINKMVSNFGAIDNWDEKLSETVGKRKILTMELEKLWLTDRPIMFVGTIEDAANADDQNAYSISIGYFGKSWVNFSSPLSLSLRCPKALFDTFLKEHPKVLSEANDVAVIAKINKVESHVQQKDEGDKATKVGIGLCLDIIELPVDLF